MVLEQDIPEVFAIKLSTGYEVEVDLTKTSRSWLPHLARAIIGERFFEASKTAGAWQPEVISEEIRYLMVTLPTEHKEALVGQVMWEAVMKLYRKMEKRAVSDKSAQDK